MPETRVNQLQVQECTHARCVVRVHCMVTTWGMQAGHATFLMHDSQQRAACTQDWQDADLPHAVCHDPDAGRDGRRLGEGAPSARYDGLPHNAHTGACTSTHAVVDNTGHANHSLPIFT